MKRIFGLLALAILLITSSSVYAQKGNIITDKIKVEGNCSMCKERIEEAAYLPGVKRADWDKDSKTLTITYKSSKVSKQKIEEHIAHAGHDTEDVKADATAYKSLPSCCAYKENTCEH